MKKWLLIFSLFLLPGFAAFSQEEDSHEEGGKIVERMKEYIQKNLGLSRAEAKQFSPVFIRYFREFVQTHRLYKTDRLILQQKIIDLRLRYRGEFRQIMDEQRANKVFKYEDEFRVKARDILMENKQRRVPFRRTRALPLQ